MQRQIAAGGGRIPTQPSVIRGSHPDLRGMGNPMRAAEMEADYADGARLNRVTLGALRDAVAALELVPGRKSLVVVSEGIVDDPDLRELDQIVDAARVANAASTSSMSAASRVPATRPRNPRRESPGLPR